MTSLLSKDETLCDRLQSLIFYKFQTSPWIPLCKDETIVVSRSEYSSKLTLKILVQHVDYIMRHYG